MADTESLITEWETSGNAAQIAAAGIARKIASKKRYDELPLNSEISAEYDVSDRTVTSAKSILRDHGILILENRRYYVALPRQPPDTTTPRTGRPAMGMYRHDAMPKPGTLRSEASGQPTDGRTPALYPMTATCKSCNRRIRLKAYQGEGWKHAAAPGPAATVTPIHPPPGTQATGSGE
jgi:hypothetical protein